MSRIRLALVGTIAFATMIGVLSPALSDQAVLARHTMIPNQGPSSPETDTGDTVEAIVTLAGEPVANLSNDAGSASSRTGRVNLQSDRAQSYAREIESRQAAFISKAAEVAGGFRVKGQLRVLANAISLEVQRTDLDAIAQLPGVQNVEIERTCHVLLNRSVPLIGAPAMWGRLGGPSSAGNGIKIAIVDTGIDIASPLMSDIGLTAPPGFPRGNTAFTNNKVIVAKAFLPGSNRTPEDGFGHGTAVAGACAGSLNTPTIAGPISGVAPRAFLGNYRVLDEKGEGGEFQVTAGLEEAVKDGFDVANISLGVESTGTLSLLGNAVEKAVGAGMVVVVAAGNQGADGKQTIDSPAEAPSAIAVGASGNGHIIGAGLIVGGPAPLPDDVGTDPGVLACCGNLGGSVGPLPCVDVSSSDPAHDGCAGLPAGSLAGKIALLQNSRGDCAMVQKLNAVRSAGAAGAVVFSLDSTVGTSPSELEPAGIPSISIDRNQGRALRSWVRQHPGAPVTISPAVEFQNDTQVDVAQTFSSLGPSRLGQLKPDIDAPGANILTAAPTEILGFAPASGTSLAAPHVSGGAALVKQLHPSWAPDQVKSALMSSADPVVATPKRTESADALTAGAGRVNVDRAGSVAATFSPASLSFGFKKLKPKSAITPVVTDFKITNVSASTTVYSISGSSDDSSLSLGLSSNSVTLAPGQTGSITVTIIVLARKAANNLDHTGSVLITGPNGQTLHIPYWVRFGDVKAGLN